MRSSTLKAGNGVSACSIENHQRTKTCTGGRHAESTRCAITTNRSPPCSDWYCGPKHRPLHSSVPHHWYCKSHHEAPTEETACFEQVNYQCFLRVCFTHLLSDSTTLFPFCSRKWSCGGFGVWLIGCHFWKSIENPAFSNSSWRWR